MFYLAVRNLDPIVSWLGDWLAEINFYSIIIRLVLAILFGGLLGFERSTKKHPAGLRTYILVCIGSTVASMANQFMSEAFDADASRIGANIITGIGFLGAGTIIVTSRSKIRGLTTAAGLWCCACIGLALGIGFYSLALCGFVLVLVSLQVLPFFEKLLIRKSKFIDLHVEFTSRPNLKVFINYLRSEGIKVISIEHNQAYSQSGLSVYEITIAFQKKTTLEHSNNLLKSWAEMDYIEFIERT